LPMQLMLVFAIAALFLSAVGVYGVCAYLVESRTREFGIRMALGAPQSSVLRLALSASLVAAGIGIVVGTPLAWLGARQVRALLYSVAPADPVTIMVSVAVLAVAVAIAAFVPARRAARVDPLVAMRAE
ncbi:MAG TPA: FtsX-like permease family protein, partial [Gemmatimonadaceae bacterium]|nr:FtsX-like permease family protein [Gemmatimonadaceae bacterium]